MSDTENNYRKSVDSAGIETFKKSTEEKVKKEKEAGTNTYAKDNQRAIKALTKQQKKQMNKNIGSIIDIQEKD